jgi:hypothetical protein
MSSPEPPPVTDATDEEIDLDELRKLPDEQHGIDHAPYEGQDEADHAPEADVAPQPLSATCKRDFTAVHHGGTRALSQINLVVVHSTESNSARGSAEWFANPASGGSAHIVVDGVACYRTLDNDVIPWGAPGANTRGFHVEHTGWARWSQAEWLQHEQTLRRGAYKSALHALRFGIPIRWLGVDDLRRGRAGFVTHATVTKWNPPPDPRDGHHDPGTNFPADHYLQLVKQFAAELET